MGGPRIRIEKKSYWYRGRLTGYGIVVLSGGRWFYGFTPGAVLQKVHKHALELYPHLHNAEPELELIFG